MAMTTLLERQLNECGEYYFFLGSVSHPSHPFDFPLPSPSLLVRYA